MIKVQITNEMLKLISAIDEKRYALGTIELPKTISNKLRKNSKKRSSYSSNKIEGNPLNEQQAFEAIEADEHRHFLRPEQEVRNYYLALNLLEKKIENKEKLSKELILEVQALIENGASKEKIGLRGPMPPGFLFAVYDSITGNPDYIPPEYSDIEPLLDELVKYVNTTDDHPLIVAGILHYQLVTIHPFEDGNGRTARLISGYLLDYYGYGFNGIGSLDEHFAYNPDEYYSSLQMGLHPLYYEGRNNPPHHEVWINYFLRMVKLHADKAYEISKDVQSTDYEECLSHLSYKEKEFLAYLLKNKMYEFRPIDISKMINITNRTVINRCAALALNGFITPSIVNKRITSYSLSNLAKESEAALKDSFQND